MSGALKSYEYWIAVLIFIAPVIARPLDALETIFFNKIQPILYILLRLQL